MSGVGRVVCQVARSLTKELHERSCQSRGREPSDKPLRRRSVPSARRSRRAGTTGLAPGALTWFPRSPCKRIPALAPLDPKLAAWCNSL